MSKLLPFNIDVKITPALIGAVGVLGLIGYFLLKSEVSDFADAVNPADSENVINKAVEKSYQQVTGSVEVPGADFYETYHTPTGDINIAPWHPAYLLVLASDKMTGADVFYTEKELAYSQALN